jgi:hypothetical protein
MMIRISRKMETLKLFLACYVKIFCLICSKVVSPPEEFVLLRLYVKINVMFLRRSYKKMN